MKKSFSVPTELISEESADLELPDAIEVDDILAKAQEDDLSISNINKLLNGIISPEFNESRGVVMQIARDIRKRVYDCDVIVMAPIEVGNVCVSECDFCGWKRSNKHMERSRLSVEIALAQAEYLIGKGINHIEYVCGDDPKLVRDEFPKLIEETKNMFPDDVNGKVQVCTMALTQRQYEELKSCGADGMIVWQEAYDKSIYNKHIVAGPKANGIDEDWRAVVNGDGYTFRLESQDRAIEAGLDVALGSMLGLNPNLKYEMMATILHTRHLIEHHGLDEQRPVIIGMPTWNKITTPTADMRPAEYQDIESNFAYLTALYFLSLPKSKAWLFPNCRVSLETQIEALLAGGYFTSTEVKVGPGGYLPQMLKQADNNKRIQLTNLIANHLKIPYSSIAELEHVLDGREQFQHYHYLHEKYIQKFSEAGLNIIKRFK